MVKLSIVLVLVAIALAGTGAEVSTALENAKLEILKRELPTNVDLIRKIKIGTPESKVQLASMATDYKTALNMAVYALNNVVPNVADDKSHKLLAYLAELLSNYSNDVQKALSGDSEALKEKLIAQLGDTKEEMAKFEAEFKATNEFVSNQINRKHDIYIFAFYKLKTQASLFDKTNKELENELSTTFSEYDEALKRLRSNDKITERELRHALYHLSSVIERAVYKLENWVELNPEKVEEVKRVQEVATTLSGLYEKLINVANKKFPTLLLKAELIKIYKDAVQKVKVLAQIEYPENLGHIEFIRSTLFDFITFGTAYGENIKAVIPSV